MPASPTNQAKKRTKKSGEDKSGAKKTSGAAGAEKKKKSSSGESSTSLSSSGSDLSLNKPPKTGSPKKSKRASSTDKKAAAKKRSSTSAQQSQSSSVAAVKEEMAKYVIWRRPFITFYYFLRELIDIIISYIGDLLAYRKLVTLACMLVALVTLGFYTDGSHLPLLMFLRKKALWYLYWVGLGIASSIGLGTGLHTFLLYLGPFIAQVTLAAYECDSLGFPEPPYPDEIMCPNGSTSSAAVKSTISILSIMSKVRIESFMWGAGTALGELPPYFMARTHALSAQEDRKSAAALGLEDEDEEFAEFEQLLKAEQEGSKDISFVDRLRLAVFKLIKRVGFVGILLCASIPNPLYDLAGITCGHFLVPFTTFFGATLIGKAVVKMHIQKLFVIFLFSEHHLASLFQLLSTVPVVGTKIEPLFQEWLNKEKKKLHRKSGSGSSADDVQLAAGGGESILSWVLNKLVLMMVLFFVVSIVNSLAQRRYKRLNTPGLLLPTSQKSKKSPAAKVAND